jgi:hypothetical protein
MAYLSLHTIWLAKPSTAILNGFVPAKLEQPKLLCADDPELNNRLSVTVFSVWETLDLKLVSTYFLLSSSILKTIWIMEICIKIMVH